MNLTPEQKIEILLFSSGGEVSKKELLEKCDISPESLDETLVAFKESILDRPFELVTSASTISLVFSKESAEFLKKNKEVQPREIGNASAETLACILYLGPLTKGEIDELRSVDSRAALSDLSKRGYIEKDSGRKYILTIEALESLGLTAPENAPHFEEISKELRGEITPSS